MENAVVYKCTDFLYCIIPLIKVIEKLPKCLVINKKLLIGEKKLKMSDIYIYIYGYIYINYIYNYIYIL